jgi:anti-anti-sigma factor
MSEWNVGFERSETEGRLVLAVTGEIDLSVAGRFGQELESLVDDSSGTGSVDLSGVGFIDSSGVRELLKARRSAQVAGGELSLANPSPACRRVLEISGVLSEFSIRES